MLLAAGCSPTTKTPSASGSSGAVPAIRGDEAVCPLSGTPAPGGVVPNQPAVAVKVENAIPGRPQYGLSTADLVYEEPVEAGITRFIAVYQCHSAARIEPVRSARLVDALILPQLGDPVFGFAGGINPSVAAVNATSAKVVNDLPDPGPFSLDPARVAPHNLKTSTSALLKAAGNPKGPPSPIFTYSPKPTPAGLPAPTVHLYLGQDSDVWWLWNVSTGRYLRYYGATATSLTPAKLGGGGQIQAANVVVEAVAVTPSRYVEDANGVHENLVGVVGSGPAEVVRNGVVIKGTWEHPSAAAPTQLRDRAGNLIPLAPGPTWIEFLPAGNSASPAP